MEYIEIIFETADTEIKDVIVALLSEAGYEGFTEGEQSISAYIPEGDFDLSVVKDALSSYDLKYEINTIAQQNWNAAWEENFQPVIVAGFCTVRADFHKMSVNTPYEIIITPKMSFGTGHHATTQLMMTEMRKIDFNGKDVLDFGTGTGILAILAEKLGAEDIVAIDNDEWSYENAKENIERNDCHNIAIMQGTLDMVEGDQFAVILANINRHILLQYMADLHTLLRKDGLILMSGLLVQDKNVILEAAADAGLTFVSENELNNWITLCFKANDNL